MTLEDRVMRIIKDSDIEELVENINWDEDLNDAENSANVVKSLLEYIKINKE